MASSINITKTVITTILGAGAGIAYCFAKAYQPTYYYRHIDEAGTARGIYTPHLTAVGAPSAPIILHAVAGGLLGALIGLTIRD